MVFKNPTIEEPEIYTIDTLKAKVELVRNDNKTIRAINLTLDLNDVIVKDLIGDVKEKPKIILDEKSNTYTIPNRTLSEVRLFPLKSKEVEIK